jgi:hypothetical protein
LLSSVATSSLPEVDPSVRSMSVFGAPGEINDLSVEGHRASSSIPTDLQFSVDRTIFRP